MANNSTGWLKYAIATTAGWVNPNTGEILSVVKNLPNAVPYIRGKKDYGSDQVIPEPTPEPETLSEEVSQPEDTNTPEKPAKPVHKKPRTPKQ